VLPDGEHHASIDTVDWLRAGRARAPSRSIRSAAFPSTDSGRR
jgi:hypothetical protein